MSKIIFRSTDIQSEKESRIITGRAIVFESWSKNLGGFYEIIHRGAITQELIDKSDIIMNINHDDEKMVARSRQGKGTLSVSLRDDGVYFSFEAPTTSRGDELLYNVRNGNIFECSFAFTIPDDLHSERWYVDSDNVYRREVNVIDGLYDMSLVIHGAYSDTNCQTRCADNEVLNPGDKITEYRKKIDKYLDDKMSELTDYKI